MAGSSELDVDMRGTGADQPFHQRMAEVLDHRYIRLKIQSQADHTSVEIHFFTGTSLFLSNFARLD